MARKLPAPGPLDTLEQAFDLMQRAPASVWLRYLAGAAPLLVGLMFVWNKFSSPHGTNSNPAHASLLLLVLCASRESCRAKKKHHTPSLLFLFFFCVVFVFFFYRGRKTLQSQLRWL